MDKFAQVKIEIETSHTEFRELELLNRGFIRLSYNSDIVAFAYMSQADRIAVIEAGLKARKREKDDD